jgi:glycosyltransferase involved in cell wall biosynthesis
VEPNRNYWLKRLNLENEDYLIGVFGFISEYKGIQTAISALEFLPKEYKLLIIGRQHPRTIREHMLINPFLKKLLKKIKLDKKNNLKSRIIFTNELEDSEFMELAATVDCAWLPYLETGQDGSGVASILFDLSKRVVASQCKVFDELFRLVPEYKCERFDIGNYMELAGKTINYFEYRNLNKRMSYSDESQTYLYLNLLSE